MSKSTNNADMAENEAQPRHRILELVLKQPTEIRHLIFKALEPKSLLSVRQTSKRWHTEIHGSEDAICNALEKQHLPVLVPNFATFFRLICKYESHCELASIIASRITDNMRFTPLLDNASALDQWRSRKQRRLTVVLTRAFVILGHYLDLYRDMIVENEALLQALDDDDIKSLQNIFDFDQQELLKQAMPNMTERDFIDVSSALHVFKHVCKARLVPLNLKSHAFPFASVRQVLVHLGLSPFVLLLNGNTDPVRQRESLQKYGDILVARRQAKSPKNDKPELSSIHHFDGYSQSARMRHDLKRHSKARDAFICHQDIWDRAARAVMMSKLGRYPVVLKPDDWIRRIVVERGEHQIFLGAWDKVDRA